MIRKLNEMPVYILSLELENVRCFGRKQTLDLRGQSGKPAPWTLILGNNGVGKTTLLQCLNWMRPVQLVDERTGKEGVQPALTDQSNLVVSSLLRNGDSVVLTLGATFAKGKSLRTTRKASIRTGIKLRGKSNRLTADELTENIGRVPPEPMILAYSADRRMGRANLDRAETSEWSAGLAAESTELYDAAEILEKLDYAAQKKNSRARKLLQRLKEALATILPDIPDADSIELRGPKIGPSSSNGGITLRTSYGSVPLESLSLGYQAVTALVVDIAWRLIEANPESRSPLKEPAIVLIDEIDQHLHPRWQRQIMTDLSSHFPGVQFVATAHSPLLVDASQETNLAVLTQTGGEVLITNDPQVVRGWRVDQILTSELFGLETTRAPRVEAALSERRRLLEMARRTPAQKRQLEAIESQLRELPTAEFRGDQAAMEVVRKAAALVKQRGGIP